ncbi:MAG: hypothetical protein SVU32_01390, partial [Candidatus Nanohaloarchaea archaeon]|nr:hypothetical protein [Candidatus Nanohaloarchaea archaeon]
DIEVRIQRDGNQYQSLRNMIGSRFYNRSVQRPGNPATYHFRFRIDGHRGSGYWNTTIFLGIRENGTTRYNHFTVRSAIQDIELLAPANQTNPGNRLVNFSFRFRSPLREELSCAILFQGDTPADIELQNSTVGSLTEVQLQPRRYPARWRVWCDNDRDGRQERGEYSRYRWFNDTVRPTVDLQRPRSGKTLNRDPLTIKATAKDNFLGVGRVSYSVIRIRNGSRRTFR